MTRTEELLDIVTAWRFIAMLAALLAAVIGHYGILEPELANYIRNFFIGFIGINSGGKWIKQMSEAIVSSREEFILPKYDDTELELTNTRRDI